MIKSSSEPALRAGSEGGGGYFKIFLGGGVSRIFNSRGGFGIPPPLAIPDYILIIICTHTLHYNNDLY